MSIILDISLFALGLIVLLKGADWSTDSASRIAKHFGVSNVIIGLSLLALSTSLPELAVSATASLLQSGGIAAGNVVGSNVANISLVLGSSVLFMPLLVDEGNIEEGTILFTLLVVSALYMVNGLSRLEGGLLLLFIFVYLYDLFRYGEKRIEKVKPDYNIKKESFLFILGIGGVVIGSRFLVSSAVSIAKTFQVSEVIIASTVIAIGTSLPELSVSLSAAKKGFKDLALGNIIGSCMFNISLVLGISAVITPVQATKSLVLIDLPFMLITSGFLLLFMKTRWKLSRKEGVFFLGIYALFISLHFILA